MDFWSRLIGGSRSLTSKSFRATSPTERLTAFKRTCNSLQQIWRTSNSPAGEQSAISHARNCIERLNSVLSDESRGPAPHPCLAYAASSQIFVTVTKLALSSHDDGTLRSAAVLFNTLIDAEVDGVVDNRLFARALVDLVRRADKHSEEVEGRLVELLFGVANNIRLQPAILPAWFAPRSVDGQEGDSGNGGGRQSTSGKEFEGATRKDDFPLFYLLVEYVHHEGRAGDFARTGLLYLIETASRSKQLERWLIDSDLATLMATGLGALYSQLGSLSFVDSEEKPPHIIALSDHAGQETAIPPYLGAPMMSFMSYLLFWQDTIDHCKSAEVNGTLLDHFQILFLEQLLYPSLLESSDVEGGSTAAVMTYLYRILESIHQEDLVHRILHFLLASPNSTAKKKGDMSLSRRKSLDVLAAFSEEAARPSPSLFNLRDLALLGLQSANRQTVLATLRLLAIVLQRHHPFARSLIRTVPGQPAKQRTVGAQNAELENLLLMATSIVDDPTLNNSYENYLKDASWILEAHLCIAPIEANPDDATANQPLELQQDDPLIREMLNCLGNFFTNSVVVNLALTEVLMSIASSHLLSLDGWILVDASKYNYTQDAPETGPANGDHRGQSIMDQIQFAYQEPSWSDTDTPTLTAVLQKLVQQTREWRKSMPDFDILVAARRDLLHQDDEPANVRSSRVSSSERPPTRAAQRESELGFPRGRSSRPLGGASSTSASASPHQRAAMGSLSRESSVRPLASASRESSISRAEGIRKRLSTPFYPSAPAEPTPKIKTEEQPRQSTDEGEEDNNEQHQQQEQQEQQQPTENGNETESAVEGSPPSATLGHVLTNVIILYEFLLELSATVQVRGSLYEEAGYPGVGVGVEESV